MHTSKSPHSGPNYAAWHVSPDDYQSLRDLIRWAVLAPSSHNTQPWAFSVEQDSVIVAPDLQRALRVSDPSQRQLYISVGAAVANLKLAAHYFGWHVEEELLTDSPHQTLCKRLRFQGGYTPTPDDAALFQAIPQRVSNRSAHEPRPIPREFKEVLSALGAVDGVHVGLIEDAEEKAALARLVCEADRVILTDPGFIGELSTWVRPNATGAFDGMPGFGFGVPDFPSRLFPAIVRSGMLADQAPAQDQQLLQDSTAAVGVISIAHDDPAAWLQAGELFQIAALRAVTLGLATNVLAVLVETRDYYKDLQRLLDTAYRPQVMFRLGYPVAETPRAPRRPLPHVLQVGSGIDRRPLPRDKPTLIKLHEPKYTLADLCAELGQVAVQDRYRDEWLAELMMLRHPALDFASRLGQDALEQAVAARANDFDGVWVYFPWRSALVHILDRGEFLELLFSRNYPCFEQGEQDALARLKVGIAGLSVGSNIARALAMTGVQHLKIADFDTIAPSNNNRIGAGSVLNVGERKTSVLSRELYEFNPYIDLRVYPEGLNDFNLGDFLDDLDVFIDHMDNIPLKIKTRERARQHGVITLMATDIFLSPIFDIELPDDLMLFGGRASEATIDALRQPPTSFAHWAKMAVDIFGLENTPAPLLRNFIDVLHKQQNYGSQLGLTGYAAAAQLAYFVYEIARGNAAKLPRFKHMHLEQPDLFDSRADEQARAAFRREFS